MENHQENTWPLYVYIRLKDLTLLFRILKLNHIML